MSQQTAQSETLEVPRGVTNLVVTMHWELPGNIQPDPWVLAYGKNGNENSVIDGQHAHPHCRKTRNTAIALDHATRTATLNLPKLHEVGAKGISFLGSLYFSPQSNVRFNELTKPSIEIATLRYGRAEPLVHYGVEFDAAALNTYFLPLASLIHQGDRIWSFVPGWCPLRYGL